MSTYRTRDGRTLTWSGRGICVCTKCDEIFNSVAAFDMHLRDRDGQGAHHFADMPRNARGYLVTSLREPATDPAVDTRATQGHASRARPHAAHEGGGTP